MATGNVFMLLYFLSLSLHLVQFVMQDKFTSKLSLAHRTGFNAHFPLSPWQETENEKSPLKVSTSL